MKLATGIFWVGVFATAGCSTTPGEAQAPAATPVAAAPAATPVAPAPAATPVAPAPVAATTIWDGVYTSEQADRGELVARQVCFACHGQRDWVTPVMIPIWSGRPILDFYDNLMFTMPYDNPASLSREQYADVLSYILELNGVPAGSTPLPANARGLGEIQVTRGDEQP